MPTLLSLWPDWTRPYWLLCVPLVLLLSWGFYRTQQSKNDWRSWLPEAFQTILLKSNSAKDHNSRYWLLGCAWLCAILALLGPSWEQYTPTNNHERDLPPLVIALELTPEMLAEDLAPSRLDQAREKINNLLKERDAAYTALVVYAGSAHTLVPLSNDLLTSQNLLQALQPDLMPTPGKRADLAIARAIDLLAQGAQGEGQILLFSTGVSTLEQAAIEQHLQRQPIELKIIGVGSTAGAPIVQSTQGHLLTDATGAIIISRLNETSLQLLAEHTQSPYSRLSTDDSDLLALDMFTPVNHNLTAAISAGAKNHFDQGYWLILPLLLITASFARRGSLLIVLVCVLPAQEALAFNLEDLWLRPDQQGARLIAEQPALAAERFTDMQWRATALYLAEDYQAAAELFAQREDATAHYNRGNALALAGALQDAIAAYQQALTQAPNMLAAQYNLAVVTEHLTTASDATEPAALEPNPEAPAQPSTTATPAIAVAPSTTASAAADDPSNTGATPAFTAAQKPDTPTVTKPSTTASSDHPASSEPAPTEQPIQLEDWLEQIPDNPSELLKRKFWYEQNAQETAP